MKAEDIVFWFFFLLTLVLLAWKVFGESPGLEAIAAAAFGSLSTALFKMYRDFYGFRAEMHGFKVEMHGFRAEVLARLDRIEKNIAAR